MGRPTCAISEGGCHASHAHPLFAAHICRQEIIDGNLQLLMNVQPLCVFAAIALWALQWVLLNVLYYWGYVLDNAAETAQQIPILDMLASRGHNINCICNGLWTAPDTMHRYCVTPTSLVPPGLCKWWLYTQAMWAGICPNCMGHWELHRPKCWDWFSLFCSKFIVFCTHGANLSHSCNGNSLSVVARAAMNVSLNVWISLSAALTRWLCGLTTCKSQSFLVRNIF